MLKLMITTSLLALTIGAAQAQAQISQDYGQRGRSFVYDSGQAIPAAQRSWAYDFREPGNGSPNWRDGSR